ncbi:hypothetical protein CEXT_272021 [Caerostris extrusa]|uniref:Uncharacterized protein n=1 Tax=Caerostris extrusa TaxID=172846 RepID=A0AAV4NZV9_CAEEX|nr:hypothetical protein CEXT_272021 [Caerostris extrusa]
MNIFKIAQQNLQHSKAATLLFIKLLEEKDFSIACVQEPYITNEHIPGIPIGWKQFHSKNLQILNYYQEPKNSSNYIRNVG